MSLYAQAASFRSSHYGHSKILSPTSTPLLARATPPTAFTSVINRTKRGFYFPLADELKCSKVNISLSKKHPQHKRRSRISLPKEDHKFVNTKAKLNFQNIRFSQLVLKLSHLDGHGYKRKGLGTEILCHSG